MKREKDGTDSDRGASDRRVRVVLLDARGLPRDEIVVSEAMAQKLIRDGAAVRAPTERATILDLGEAR